jgi:hypothetical protein
MLAELHLVITLSVIQDRTLTPTLICFIVKAVADVIWSQMKDVNTSFIEEGFMNEYVQFFKK